MASTTKCMLAASLKNLLGIRLLDKITVKDIVDDADVTRQTFYYHFRDIYDLICWIFDQNAKSACTPELDTLDWSTRLIATLAAMQQEHLLVMSLFHSISRAHLEQYLNNVIYTLICDQLEEYGRDLTFSDEDKRFIADFYKYAFVGILMEWIRKGMKDNPKQLVDKLLYMLNGEIRRSLEKFSI